MYPSVITASLVPQAIYSRGNSSPTITNLRTRHDSGSDYPNRVEDGTSVCLFSPKS